MPTSGLVIKDNDNDDYCDMKKSTRQPDEIGEVLVGTSIAVHLPKALFHYDEDATAWLSRDDVTEFLKGEMLNISIIQVFMRYFVAELFRYILLFTWRW